MTLDNKTKKLLGILREGGGVLVAFSGGVDSSFLLKSAVLSGARVVAATSHSETTPERDIEDARRFAGELGIEHVVVATKEMEDENFVKNSPQRCYHCKRILFGELASLARRLGLDRVVDGSNTDDIGDYRPGRKAATEFGVMSPLVEAGFSKQDIREASKKMGLSLWDKPSSPCLSSRFAYGTVITKEALRRVSNAEGFLRSLGFENLRVRDHGGLARVEVPEDEISKAVKERVCIVEKLRELGYDFVCLDLEGLKTGSLNRVLQ